MCFGAGMPKILRVAPRAICVRPAHMGSAVLLAVPEADAGQREVEARADHQPRLGEWCSAYEVEAVLEGKVERVWVCVGLVVHSAPSCRPRKAKRQALKGKGRT